MDRQIFNKIMPLQVGYKPHGQAGTLVSDWLPHLAECVDDLAIVRSCHGDMVVHSAAQYELFSGRLTPGFPSMGSWILYGLGSESDSLPAYVVLDDPLGLPVNGIDNWQAGYLPPVYQGTRFRATGSPLLNLKHV